jgi:hypothetical protein
MSLAVRSIPRHPDPVLHTLPPLRSLLVGQTQRASHPHAYTRELAPGLHEVVAVVRPYGALEIPAREELRVRGLADPDAFLHARLGTCSEPLEFGRAGPLPGVHAHVLGGPGTIDTTVAVFDIADRLADLLGPPGLVVAVPSRGMALFIAPGAGGLTRALTRFGRQRQFWTSDDRKHIDPPKLPASVPPALAALQFLASWTEGAHARFPDPVSPGLYWHRPGRPLTVLVRDVRRPDALAEALAQPVAQSFAALATSVR